MKLTEFVTNEPYLIAKMFTMNTTQRCESFNAELGSAIPKTFTNYHYNLGVYSTIIKHNEPNFYNDFLEVTDAHKPLDKCRNRITHYYDLRKEFNVKRRTPEMRKRKNCFEYPINFIIVGFLAHIMISSSRSLIYFFALRHLRNLLL
ncbi:hypothetical protein M9Y10_010040 [Tritrichomonas musculus]|uniref:MULE domain-containing protein n=1 Tax=Tritrichomonas musculus TaxID=1915356 RepID=A0ABR2IS13_9EUKA